MKLYKIYEKYHTAFCERRFFCCCVSAHFIITYNIIIDSTENWEAG